MKLGVIVYVAALNYILLHCISTFVVGCQTWFTGWRTAIVMWMAFKLWMIWT